jgi:hypothetical protein
MSASSRASYDDAPSHHASHVSAPIATPPSTSSSHLDNAPVWSPIADVHTDSHGARPSSPVSLFSPNVVTDPTAPARAGSSTSPSNSSRPLATLSGVANMKRTARLKVSDQQPSPIVQFSARIPSAQKDADDPTTPPDSRRNTWGRDYSALTTLSRLFAGDGTMPNSRTPSYNQASGPLYMRGMLPKNKKLNE